MTHPGDDERQPYEDVEQRLAAEFAAAHPPETVARCVAAARYGALEVVGSAEPGLVERIARKHLEVLALVAAERRRRRPRSTLGNAP
ncbi:MULTISPECIES: three-helix bundle dimerization domain-containing protein [Actinomadura]|uniref:Uncharacterized protein n=2 Tax=Actinomadura TaxID=1988 RepID=A0A2P4UMT2_9ACTN|nr:MULTISPECIES: hypothetical protein [Actinomadura]MXQ65522.1 hypothetical protein [Actinomadura rayongensis]POM26361.1 hypothetical protein BTM25_07590 [Actinomadura rubteroloni]